jgi:Ca-activated chloride channel family protein
MSGLGLNPVIPWPLAVLLGVVLLGLAVAGLVTRPARRAQWGLRTAAAGAAALALLGPGVPGEGAPQGSSAVDVWFVVDTTSSAVARDHPGGRPRMDGYREDIPRIAEALPGARFALVTFDSTARTSMPLTTDADALATAVETMRQEVSL